MDIEELKLKLVNTDSVNAQAVLQGVSIDQFDKFGNNILHYFVKNFRSIDVDPAQFVEQLVLKGLDINIVQEKPPHKSALHLAVMERSEELVELLVGLGIKIDITDEHGNTSLWQSVINYRNDSSFFMEHLIENGADVNKENEHGVSPLSLSETIANFDSRKFFPS